MKRFIIISFLAVLTVPSFGCLWIDTDNYYLFNICNGEDFAERADKITRDNWKAYLGVDEFWWFDADKIIQFAQEKNDALMVSYVQNLVKYIDCANSVKQERWEYPTKAELAKRKQTLMAIRTYAQSKLKTRLRSQHALLFMRCNMLLGRHAENVTFWVNTASLYIESIYRDMMRNIYAGALLKTGSPEIAGQIFAEQNDWSSLMTQYYKKRTYADIRKEYLRDPNSAVLPFLLQDFVNNAQEAFDGGFPGKLFVRSIEQVEARQMMQFAGQVAREGKTQNPALWKSVQAWLEYLYGNKQQALTEVNEAVTLDGTDRIKDNARALRFYIASAQTPLSGQFDDYVAGELEWLTSMRGDDYYGRVMTRVVNQVLVKKYGDAGRQQTTLALLKSIGSYGFQYYMDTVRVEGLRAYMDYVKTPATTKFDRFLKANQDYNEDAMNDLMGTKYLRLCQWEKALPWLERVPLSYYNEQGYKLYAALRNYNVEPWVKRQWLPEYMEGSSDIRLQSNPKVAFAREMLQMEGELNVLSAQARQQRYYDLAVCYAQASFTGDCWFLMRNGKSAYDEVRVNEVDLAAKAKDYLQQALPTKDRQLKERVLFALSYVYLNPDRWCTFEWNNETADLVRISQPETAQYKAFASLADFERTNGSRPSEYVSRCDEYIQFESQYKSR